MSLETDMSKWRPDKNLFKVQSGYAPRWLTGAIFVDAPRTINTVMDVYKYGQYTYEDEHKYINGKFYPSLKKLYLETGDPTEYKFYTKWLGGKEHWEKCLESLNFKQMVDKWREELEIKIRSEAVVGIGEMAKKGQYAACLFFAKGGWKVSPQTHTGGAPTKRERERADRINKAIEQDGESADVIRLLGKAANG